jgi:hypothetical protein
MTGETSLVLACVKNVDGETALHPTSSSMGDNANRVRMIEVTVRGSLLCLTVHRPGQ